MRLEGRLVVDWDWMCRRLRDGGAVVDWGLYEGAVKREVRTTVGEGRSKKRDGGGNLNTSMRNMGDSERL